MAAEPIPPQEFHIRAGDDLPTLAVVIEDEYGNPVNLTDAHVWMVVTGEHRNTTYVEVYVANAAAGVVTFDWDRRHNINLDPGEYQMSMTAIWPDGSRLTAPSDRSTSIIVRPGVHGIPAADYWRDLLERTGRTP